MTSEHQIKANRYNAKQSTGPITRRGKAITAQNSLKHGVFSKQIVLKDESQQEFDALQKEFYDHFSPLGLLEGLFCQRALAAAWRLSRITLMESQLLTQAARQSYFEDIGRVTDNGASNQLTLLSRYEISLEKILFRSLSELRALQRDRQTNASSNGFVPQNLLEDLHEET